MPIEERRLGNPRGDPRISKRRKPKGAAKLEHRDMQDRISHAHEAPPYPWVSTASSTYTDPLASVG